MKIEKRLLHQRKKGTFQKIHGDRELLKKITVDMLENGGKLVPILHWQMIEKEEKEFCGRSHYSDNITVERYEKAFEKMYQSSDQFLDHWIGVTGCQKWSEEQMQEMLPFLTRIDSLGLLDQINENQEIDWLHTDLKSLVDINLLNCYLPESASYILEVGGVRESG